MVAKLNTRYTALKVLSLTALVFALPAAEAFAGSRLAPERHSSKHCKRGPRGPSVVAEALETPRGGGHPTTTNTPSSRRPLADPASGAGCCFRVEAAADPQ